MRIALLCDDEPFNIPRTVLEVMRARPGDSFWIFPLGGHGSMRRILLNARRYLTLYGLPGFVVMGVRFASRRLKGLLGVRRGAPYSLAQSASLGGAGLVRIRSVNSLEGRKILADIDPDVIVSIACPQILRKKTLALARKAAINVHSALLPRNRGMLPTFWSLMEDPPSTGVTVHEMAEKLDAGDILAQRAVPASIASTTLQDLLESCKRAAADLLVEVLGRIESDTIERRPNHCEGSAVNPFPSRADVREFRRRGGSVL